MQLYWAAFFKFTQQHWKWKSDVMSIWNNISKCRTFLRIKQGLYIIIK